ncbi:hypothetical protein M0R45_036009 [Rubus argutus]|uniref:Uncharacterized protein n=1 Tax=Rubus argutus TaxID=59490 RepID=A0AAW1VWC0_RUBAR
MVVRLEGIDGRGATKTRGQSRRGSGQRDSDRARGQQRLVSSTLVRRGDANGWACDFDGGVVAEARMQTVWWSLVNPRWVIWWLGHLGLGTPNLYR